MRPRVKPALRRVNRGGRTLQFGVHPLRAVVLADVEPTVREVIDGLDGTATMRDVVERARRHGLSEADVHELVGLLARCGALDDASIRPDAISGLSLAERDRLAPDLDEISLLRGTADGGQGVMRRRRSAHIRVYGAGRVGTQVVTLLAAAGVGHLCVVDPGTARRRDLAPGGLGWEQVGGRRDEGAVELARRVAPGVNAWSGREAAQLGDGARRPDLVVLAPVEPLDAVLARELTELGVPHLLAAASEGVGTVGPLVVPGRTACLACLDLVRRDRDPGWPLVTASAGGFPAGEIACGTVLSALVAAYTSGHALAFADGRESRVIGASFDVLPDWRWRRRSWNPHPHCECCRNERGSRRMVA
ncbi:ThiF family adenylyltransferase [Thermopolyspora sp. NPDC052614]|uniref:ThiF family adenylyltransferase n=1 Tax=Thermopolyspora sp. NPDC052614 TaxID=3155682 RepID=UPI003426E870